MTTTVCQRAIALLIITSFLLTSCTSLQGVPLPGPDQPSATPAVKAGETVEITTRAGSKQRFKVTAVETDALVGENVRVPYSDMTSLQVERSDPAQNGVVLWIVGGVLVTIAAVAVLDNYDDETTY